MGDKLQGPFIYDSLDKPNVSPQAPRRDNKIDWRVVLILTLAVTIILFGGLAFIYSRLLYITEHSFNSTEVWIANILIWIVNSLPIAITSAAAWYAVKWLRNLSNKAGLINVMDYQMNMNNIDSLSDRLAERLFGVMERRAERSLFAGAQTVTYNEADNIVNEAQELPPIPATIEDLLPPGNEPVLLELRKEGLINRSNDSLLTGFADKGEG